MTFSARSQRTLHHALTPGVQSYHLVGLPRACGPRKSVYSHLDSPLILRHGRNYAQAAAPRPVDHQLIDASPEPPVNPPRSTLPPPLELPARSDSNNKIAYWIKVGRSYSKFYFAGFKQVWRNYKLARKIKRTWRDSIEESPLTRGAIPAWRPVRALDIGRAAVTALEHGETGKKQDLDRATFQLVWRSEQDVKKLPLFALLILIFGEWLPLLVPFIPGIFPRPCQIPSQVEQSRKAQEERRRRNAGETEEHDKQAMLQVGKTDGDVGQQMKRLNRASLGGIAVHFDLISSKWDRLGTMPLTAMLRGRVRRHLEYLLIDDRLLRLTRNGVASLSDDEVHVACAERGMDVGDGVGSLRSRLAQCVRHSGTADLLRPFTDYRKAATKKT